MSSRLVGAFALVLGEPVATKVRSSAQMAVMARGAAHEGRAAGAEAVRRRSWSVKPVGAQVVQVQPGRPAALTIVPVVGRHLALVAEPGARPECSCRPRSSRWRTRSSAPGEGQLEQCREWST